MSVWTDIHHYLGSFGILIDLGAGAQRASTIQPATIQSIRDQGIYAAVNVGPLPVPVHTVLQPVAFVRALLSFHIPYFSLSCLG